LPRRDLQPLAPLAPAADGSPPPGPPLLLRVSDVCDQLGLSRASVQRLLSSGAIRSVQIGRSRRVLYADLQQFVDALGGGDGTASSGREATR
jgi:excisionase family DNA binding protein